AEAQVYAEAHWISGMLQGQLSHIEAESIGFLGEIRQAVEAGARIIEVFVGVNVDEAAKIDGANRPNWRWRRGCCGRRLITRFGIGRFRIGRRSLRPDPDR